MAITCAIGVEHLPQGITAGAIASAYGLGFGPWGWVGFVKTANFNPLNMFVQDNKFRLQGNSASASQYNGCYAIPIANLLGSKAAVPANLKKVVIGAFIENLVTGKTLAGTCGTFAIAQVNGTVAGITSYTAAGNQGLIMSTAGHMLQGSTTVLASGASGFVEMEMDFMAATMTFYVDGVQVSSAALGFTATNFVNYCLFFGRGGGTTGGVLAGGALLDIATYSNFYVTVDDGTAGDAHVGRLGPLTLRKLPILSVDSNPDWTSSDATAVKDVLNTRRDGANLTTPYLNNSAANSELFANPDFSAISGQVVGLVAHSAAIKSVGSSSNILVDLQYKGTTLKTTQTTSLPSAAPYIDAPANLIESLGSDPLTKANLTGNLKVGLKAL